MQCPTPISIKDKSDNNPKKLASIRLSVPCGKCGICKKNRRSQWTFRLREELKDSSNCYFITLTYSEENLPFNPFTGEISLDKKHLQDFIKRLREYEYRKTGKRKLRYYAIGEYGSRTQRPHYHAIIYNLSRNGIKNLTSIWKYGQTDIGTVTPASIHYVTKYHVNRNVYENEDRQAEFSIMSQALGKGYIKRNKKYHKETGHTFVYMDGHIINMPRYYREKIFDDIEKKYYSDTNIEKQYQVEKQEAERLKKLGYENPYYEIWKRSIHQSKQIQHKSKDSDKL